MLLGIERSKDERRKTVMVAPRGKQAMSAAQIWERGSARLITVWPTTCSEIRIRTLFDTVPKQKAIIMLNHCANARCRKPFLRLRAGKLFSVETDRLTKPGEPSTPPFVRARQRQVEHYWLCDECAAHWTLIYDPEYGVALAPRKRSAPGMAAAQSGAA